VFPVGRVASLLRKGRFARRISAGAPVAVAGALEYLVAEVVEMAGAAAMQNKRHRITPRHIALCTRSDDEFNRLFKSVDIMAGGVLPNVHPVLIKKQHTVKKRHTKYPCDDNDNDDDESSVKSKSKSKSKSKDGNKNGNNKTKKKLTMRMSNRPRSIAVKRPRRV